MTRSLLLVALGFTACAHSDYARVSASCEQAAAEAAKTRAELAAMRADYEKLRDSYDRLIAIVDQEPTQPVAEPDANRKVEVSLEGAPLRGADDARVVVVEFSDFQCPFCARVQPTLERIAQTWPKDVRFAFRHLPLPFHDRALPAARAAEAARRQGRFWEMHDLLFQNQERLDDRSLEGYARQLKLDIKLWRRDMQDPSVQQLIERDMELAGQVGANGTPTFFVNGRVVQGAQPFEAFRELVERELAATP